MAPGRKNRSAAALEPVVDTAVAVPMDIPDAMHVDVAKKVRSRKMTEPVEAEKENLVNTVVPPKRGAGKASNKARAPAEAPQPPSQPEAVEEEAQLPVAEKSQDAKPSRRAPRKKVLQDCTPVTETEVNAVAKNLQDIQLGRPQQQKGRKASSKVAEVPEVAAAEPMEEPEATEEAPKIKGALQKQQKVCVFSRFRVQMVLWCQFLFVISGLKVYHSVAVFVSSGREGRGQAQTVSIFDSSFPVVPGCLGCMCLLSIVFFFQEGKGSRAT